MERRASSEAPPGQAEPGAAHTVLARVEVRWAEGETSALVLHATPDVLVLERVAGQAGLPDVGTRVVISGGSSSGAGRVAEHGRSGRFLVARGHRPLRAGARLKCSLPATLRGPGLATPALVEIVDLTSAGARVRGIDLAVGSQLMLAFTPPGKNDAVTVSAVVVHGARHSARPCIGVNFKLVAMPGGRGRA